MNEPPAGAKTPWNTLKAGMQLTPAQHAKLAQVYGTPKPGLSPEEAQWRQRMARRHAALSRWALKANLTDRRR
jgi:putative heme degradation protein